MSFVGLRMSNDDLLHTCMSVWFGLTLPDRLRKPDGRLDFSWANVASDRPSDHRPGLVFVGDIDDEVDHVSISLSPWRVLHAGREGFVEETNFTGALRAACYATYYPRTANAFEIDKVGLDAFMSPTVRGRVFNV